LGEEGCVGEWEGCVHGVMAGTDGTDGTHGWDGWGRVYAMPRA